MTDLVRTARRIADEVLFPAAAAVDRAAAVPEEHFRRLADAGLYGAALKLDLPSFGRVVEVLAGGSLATAFVWAQHHGLVRALARPDAPPAVRDEWLHRLATGTVRAGAVYGGLLPGPPRLRATPDPGYGWLLSGQSPWLTGWGMVDVLHVAARAPDGSVVWTIVDAAERAGLSVEPLPTVAADAARTVSVRFAGLPVPGSRVTGREPHQPPGTTGVPLRTNGSLALGVAGRCLRLMNGCGGAAAELDAELHACRTALDDAVDDPDPLAMPTARAAASELAVRAAAALAVHTGAASALAGSHPDRLTREALFLLVFGSRAPIKAALLDRLAGLG